MTRPSLAQLKTWLAKPAPLSDLRAQIRDSAVLPRMMEMIRASVPDVQNIPLLKYSVYREFERTGERPGYQNPYFMRRAMLTRALVEYIAGDESMLDPIQDLLWAICEETSWVVPAHEEQGPAYWDIHPPISRKAPYGVNTSLTREPDSIDLFAAETGAILAETVYLVGDDITPEVRERVRQEVARHIFKPYLAYGRNHWWFKGDLNWNGVCNGAIALAFLRLEDDVQSKAEAVSMFLEGTEVYLAKGFEADGGSIEGVGYWAYGLMYYVTTAELLRELTGGELDLLATDRIRQIAAYPVGMALKPPMYLNFGDAPDAVELPSGIVQRLAERTGVTSLRALVASAARPDEHSYSIAKLPVTLRQIVWWDGEEYEAPSAQDFLLPTVGVIKLVGEANGKTVALAATVGHNDGHHSHVDVASFIYHIDGESLIPDAGRGKYNKDYFRQGRYQNIFVNAYTHNIPRIGGQMEQPGPEFRGRKQFYGTIVEHGERDGWKYAVIDFHTAYNIPELKLARRTLSLNPATGEAEVYDHFEFAGQPLPIEESFVTWRDAAADGDTVTITGERNALTAQADGVQFEIESLEEACRVNERPGVLKRISARISGTEFRLRITPKD